MKAAVIQSYGGTEKLEIADVDDPEPSEDEICIKVHSAGVNPIDWKMRNGKLRMFYRKKFPLILGLDVAGTVESVGERVTEFKKGHKVYGMLPVKQCGAYAEFITTKPNNFIRIPKNLTYDEAAATPVAAMTALKALKDLANIRSNMKILINGASGGVGTFAVEIAKSFGAEVTAVTSTINKEFISNLGADNHISYEEEDFTESNEIYDVVFDTINNTDYLDIKPILKSDGCYIRTGVDRNLIWSMVYSKFLPGYPDIKIANTAPNAKLLQEINDLIVDWKCKPIIDEIYSLEDIQAAHEHSEAGHARGKVVIKIK